ncbi:hypothetical protein CPB97_008311 [Podila verticillata]|nr:hypothetical protein CPB97_008311 [Podila verticillata]
MTSIKHTLTCLVHGHSAPQFFSIKVDHRNTVDQIKKLIANEPRSGMSAQDQFVLYTAMLPLDHPKVLSCHPLKLLSPLLDTSVILAQNRTTPMLHIMVERVQEGRRCFATSSWAEPVLNFYVEPSVVADMAECLLQRQVCSLVGPHQSGKSTICRAVVRWLDNHPDKFLQVTGCSQSEFEIHLVTFNGSVKVNKGPESFWKSVCRILQMINKKRFCFDSNTPIDATTFTDFFQSETCPTKRTIQIIDEASCLASPGGVSEDEKEVVEEFINTLQFLRDNNRLHALALAGTHILFELLNPLDTIQPRRVSLFSHGSLFKPDPFSCEETMQLFSQFGADVSPQFEQSQIGADIFELTGGHKGLVACCGTFLETSYKKGTPIVTMEDWKARTIDKLKEFVEERVPYSLMVWSFNSLSEECRTILTKVLLHGDCEADLTKNESKYLLAEGFLSIKKKTSRTLALLECSAPLLRSLLIPQATIPKFMVSQKPAIATEMDYNWIIPTMIQCIPFESPISWKNLNPHLPLSESVFQSEMTITLRSLIESEYAQERYNVYYEFRDLSDRVNRRQRLVILVRHGLRTVPAYGFEFSVAADNARYDENCSRAEEFGLLHDCRMTLFTMVPMSVPRPSYFEERGYLLSLVNMFMDPSSQTVRYSYKAE